jgi:hypothetical protein
MKPETPTHETKHAHDIERAQETVIESLKSQHPDWVDEKGECPRCVAYEYELADPVERSAEETK